MNKTKKRQVEIAKNMLEVQIPMEDVVEMSGLTMEEVQKLSKTIQVRVRETQDIIDFDLKDTLYHYNDKAVKVGADGKVIVDSKTQSELVAADLAEEDSQSEQPELVNAQKFEEEVSLDTNTTSQKES